MIEKKNNFKIQYTKGDTYALKITFNNISENLTSAFFTVKENPDDTTPAIQKTIGSGISLIENNLYKNQLVYKLQLQAEDSRYLQPDFQYLYDLKITLGNVVKTVISGNFIVNYTVTSVEEVITPLAEIEVDNAIETNAETTPATQGIEYEQDPIALGKIGNMTDLNTTAKNTLVDAINETNLKASTGLEEITKIENGTVTVPEATHSTSADNATNYDTSTGSIKSKFDDIEERLTNLGFKSGSIELETILPPFNATLNELKREGNYVIGNLAGTCSLGASGSSIFTKIGTLPNDFIPLSTTILNTYVKSSNNLIEANLILYSNHETYGNDVYVFIDNYMIVSGSMSLNFGFEAIPII